MLKRFLATLIVLLAFAGCATAQPFPTPVAQAVALLTSGTTTFSIVGIDANGYINWSTGRSASGYGIRDNAGVIESKNSGGSWSPLSTSGGAPSTATYITQIPNGSLSAEQALSTLSTALLLNTTTTGVLSAYTGTSCTNQFLTALSAIGAGTCASVSSSSITGVLGVTNGGTGLAAFSQGDLIYASAANTLSALAKNMTATRYLSNTGTTNNPAWAQVALATGVSGTLPVANGGTGLTSGTDGGILGYTASGTLASSVVLPTGRLIVGRGAGATPVPLSANGGVANVLHGGGAGDPTFSTVSLTTDISGILPVANGGTFIASYAIGDLVYTSASTTLSKLADVSAGSYLRSGGVTTAPVWSTAKLPNTATTGDVIYASGANTYANLSDVAAGSYLQSGGTSTAPVWSTTTLPNSATIGDVLYASAANVYSNLTAVATGRVLGSAGTGTAPAWLTNVPVSSLTASSYLQVTEVAFMSLPAMPAAGYLANINDSMTTTWGATVSMGGGTDHVLVRYNGTVWTVVGK